MQQFFIDNELELNKEIKLNKDIAHQCIHVLRYQSNRVVRIIDKNGKLALCTLRIEQENVFALIQEYLQNDAEMSIQVTLIQALIRKEKWEYFLQKATELGVFRIVPLELKRNIVKWDKDETKNKLNRYQKIVIEASEQSRRSIIPKIEQLIKISEIEKYKSDINLIAYEKEETVHIKQYLKSDQSITIICGPEGGFEENEIEYLISQGFASVSLGKRILRAETAGLYILSGIDFFLEEIKDE